MAEPIFLRDRQTVPERDPLLLTKLAAPASSGLGM
jgi:hypothetical protein